MIQQLQLHHEGFTMDWNPTTEVATTPIPPGQQSGG
jgi:hypothetical protein